MILGLNNYIKSDMVVSRHQALINNVVITKFQNRNQKWKKLRNSEQNINFKTSSKALSYFLQFNNPRKNIPLKNPYIKKKLKILFELKKKTWCTFKVCKLTEPFLKEIWCAIPDYFKPSLLSKACLRSASWKKYIYKNKNELSKLWYYKCHWLFRRPYTF